MNLDVVQAEACELVALGKTLAKVFDTKSAAQLFDAEQQVAKSIELPEHTVLGYFKQQALAHVGIGPQQQHKFSPEVVVCNGLG